MQITPLNAPRCVIGEGPVWDVAEQALFLIDILGRKVLRHDPATERTETWDVGNVIGSLAVRAEGAILCALADGLYSLDRTTGAVAPYAAPPADASIQLADGKVDARGRFVFGTSHRGMTDAIGKLYSAHPDGTLTQIDDDIILANGPCWSPDGATFYHSDSIRKAIYAYDYDLETGTLANRREWASTADLGGIPDGATVDADGLLWMAICEGAKVVAFRPDGALERVIDMPVRYPSSVMFGGPELDRLYVTSLNASFLGKPEDPQDGCTFVIDGLGARGLPEPRFGG